MRQISLTNKKVRGIPRRLRSLRRWSESFLGNFPVGLAQTDRYCNYKIPVLQSLVEGKQTTRAIQRECAQRLIDACHKLIVSKPPGAAALRVVATICLPDMYTSEVCVYSDEQYFQSKVSPAASEFGAATPIQNRSLASEWGLLLPAGIQELGLALDYRGYADFNDWYTGEHWYFGEVH
jgi:hypothetical protein